MTVDVELPFGRFKGWQVSAVPSTYLRWLVMSLPSGEIHDAALAQLSMRGEPYDPHAQLSHRTP